MAKDIKPAWDEKQPGKEPLHEEFPADVNKVLESIEPAQREILMGAMYALESRSTYSGPLPAPEDFKAYKEVLADAPERIIAMAERQQKHRIDLENKIVDSGILHLKVPKVAMQNKFTDIILLWQAKSCVFHT